MKVLHKENGIELTGCFGTTLFKSKQEMKKLLEEHLDHYLCRDTEMHSVWMMKHHNLTPEQYVLLNTYLHKLLEIMLEGI